MPNGREPVRDFLMGLEVKMHAKLADTISLLHDNGFVKKTQKTPAGEIEKARRNRADYLKRNGEK